MEVNNDDGGADMYKLSEHRHRLATTAEEEVK
jgi:hypothetical protein